MSALLKMHQASVRLPDWTDEANRQVHLAIAQKIRHQPNLLGIPVENLRMWKRRKDAGLQPILRRWKLIILTWDLEQILEYLADTGEEAVKLRRTSPFCGVLNEQEQQRALVKQAR